MLANALALAALPDLPCSILARQATTVLSAGSTLTNYSWRMREAAGDFGRKALALLVLLVAAYVLFHLVLGVVAFLAWVIVVILAIAAIVWAIRVL